MGDRDAWEAFLRPTRTDFTPISPRFSSKRSPPKRHARPRQRKRGWRKKTRLATERARKAEQDKAAAVAKAAEDSRIAAEKAKQIEQAKAEAAEQQRKAAEAAAAKALADKQAAEKAAAEAAAKQATDRQVAEAESRKIAALSPPPVQSPPLGEVVKLVQVELRRVGCMTATADGEWNSASQRSLALFNKYAGTKLDAKLASADALDALKAKPGRVCPLVCDHGFRADGDACVKIACGAGYRVNDDNECGKVQDKKPVATRDDSKKRDAERKQSESAPPKSEASGQMICNQAGCRPVAKGCRLGSVGSAGNGIMKVTGEICN